MKNFKLKDISFDLPLYMNVLDQIEIDEIITTNLLLDDKIIACGIHPDGTLTIIIASGDVKIFNPAEHYIPLGEYKPIDNGDKVFLPNNNNRWPDDSNGYIVESKWLLERSENALNLVSLFVNDSYLCDIDVKTAKIFDP